MSTWERLFNWPTPGVDYDASIFLFIFIFFLILLTVSHFDQPHCCTPQLGFGMPGVKHKECWKSYEKASPPWHNSALNSEGTNCSAWLGSACFGSEKGREAGSI